MPITEQQTQSTRTFPDGTKISDNPFFRALASEIEQDLIPVIEGMGFRRDRTTPRAGQSGQIVYLWPLYLRTNDDRLISLVVRASTPIDPTLDIALSVFRIIDPTCDDETALLQAHTPDPDTGAIQAPRQDYVRSMGVFEGHACPYRRWSRIGFLPSEIGIRYARYIPIVGFIFPFLMFFLTIPTLFLTLPIRLLGLRKEADWRKREPDQTADDRSKLIERARKSARRTLKTLDEVAAPT